MLGCAAGGHVYTRPAEAARSDLDELAVAGGLLGRAAETVSGRPGPST